MNLKKLILKIISQKPLFINQIIEQIQKDSYLYKEEDIRKEVFYLLKTEEVVLDSNLKVTSKPVIKPTIRKICLKGHECPTGEADFWEHPESTEEIECCRCHKYYVCKNCGASHGYTFV